MIKLNKLFNLGIKEDFDLLKKTRLRLLNQYYFILSLVFLINGIRGFIVNVGFYSKYALLLLSIIFFCIPFTKIKFNKKYIFIVYIFLILICFFSSSQFGIYYDNLEFGLESGMWIYYFPIISSLTIVFNNQTDKKYIYILLIIIFILFFINYISGYSLFYNELVNKTFTHNILYLSITQVIIIMIINTYFMYQKENLLAYYFYNFIDEKHKNVILKDKLKDSINDLVESAKLNDEKFLSKFSKIYPKFYEKLLSEFPKLTISDIRLCALLKLNFSTKEISTYSNLSVRTIQTKKYNLRKKLNLDSEVNLNIFMISYE